MRRACAIATLLATACAAGREPSVAGVAIAAEHVSVGGTLRVSEPSLDVRFTIELRTADGALIARLPETLPSCAGECPFGATVPGEDLGDWRRVARAHVTGVAGRRGPAAAPLDVAAARDADGRITGRAPADGILHVVALSGGAPKAGAKVLARAGRRFVVGADLVPPVARERLRAALYAGPPSPGD